MAAPNLMQRTALLLSITASCSAASIVFRIANPQTQIDRNQISNQLSIPSAMGVAFQDDDRVKKAKLVQQAQTALTDGKIDEAIGFLDEAVAAFPRDVALLQYRGETLFRNNRIESSVKDFDRVVDLSPASRASNWQRGIALYYAGRYQDGADQFEEHHRVNPDDVENTFWFYLCLVKAQGEEAAKKKIIPSRGDAREPLMDIYRLVQGKTTPQDVVKVIEASPSSRQQEAEFYGYLYLGLWADLHNDPKKAIEYLEKSLKANDSGYMADVGKVHLKQLQDSQSKPK